MIKVNYIQIILFSILWLCSFFYLVMGSYSYKKDRKSKINRIFCALCISVSLWTIGYAFMLISPNIEIANSWRKVSVLGFCFLNGIWISFALSFNETPLKSSSSKIIAFVFIVSIIFSINNLLYEPSEVIRTEAYGFVEKFYTTVSIGIIFSIYVTILFMVGLLIIYFQMKNAKKNRVRKQMKIILMTSLIGFCFTVSSDLILPRLGIVGFPFGVIAISIGMGGVWFAINKHKMMSISYELVSEYIFEAVNEPIFILGEDFLVKNCNKASRDFTGSDYKDLKQNLMNAIINFRNFKFNTIMEVGNAINIEVDLYRKNKEPLVCELSATVIYDEYKDILGILILLHDVSERKKMALIQKKYTLKLEETNSMLKNEIAERLLAEVQIRHFIYYDALTELSNRKKMLEDIEMLVEDKRKKFAILFIDLDKFKSVNDNYGHEAGDIVLKTVALRLKKIISATDTISRIGGDEFIIILRELEDPLKVGRIVAAVLKTLCTAFIYKENQLFIGSSIGMSIFPDHGIDADMLIKKADFAMYEVKRNGGNGYKLYS